jgi:hypothetical protein
MKQLVLHDDHGPILTIVERNNMTWGELYNFLASEKENNPDLFNEWVLVHNIETGDEYPCDTTVFSDNNRLVLSINSGD